MRKIGLIGGLAWPSTADFYRLLCKRANARFAARGHGVPLPTPPMVLESLNIAAMRRLRGRDGDEASWAAYDEVLRETLERLRGAGADFAVIASVTPHTRLAAIERGAALEVLSIVDATASVVEQIGARRALVLGTPVTMQSSVFAAALSARGIDVLTRPSRSAIDALEALIDNELYRGEVAAARAHIVALARRQIRDPRTDVVCLACTELPLAFPEHGEDAHFVADGLSFINTSVAHVDAALDRALTTD